MNIRIQMNDFGPIALLPDGRVEILKPEAMSVVQQVNSQQRIFSSSDFDELIAEELDVDLNAFHLKAPVIAFLEVTNLCNLTCQHCYANSAPDAKRKNELSFEEVCALLDSWDKAGVMQVFLSGGELFAHPRAVEIIQHAKTKGFLTQIFSNGLLITEEHLRQIPKGTAFFISFDTATPGKSIRGKMNYEKLEWLFEKMENHGHIFRTAVNVHNHNLEEVATIFKWCREKGYPRPQWLETLPVGRALKHPDMFLTTEKTERVIQVYRQAMGSYLVEEKSSGGRAQSVDTIKFCQRLEQALGCEKSGRMIVYVNSVGDVYPSSNYASHDRENAGNLREKSFEEIWKNGFEVARSNWFVDFEACQECPVAKVGIWCQFRCRSLSQNLHGKPMLCGATEHLKKFMLMTNEFALEISESGNRLELN